MIKLRTGGPAILLGDCLAATLVLTPTTAPCPLCGVHATDVTGGSDGDMEATLIDGIAYGLGVLVPCGHQMGGITTDAAMADAKAAAS